MKPDQEPFVCFNFWLEIDGIYLGGFTEVSGLSAETKVLIKREGGVNEFQHKLPEGTEYGNLVLKYGLLSDDQMWQWYAQTIHGEIQRKNGSVLLVDRHGTPDSCKMRWDFYDAYPVKWQSYSFNASRNEVMVQSIELVHHGIAQFSNNK